MDNVSRAEENLPRIDEEALEKDTAADTAPKGTGGGFRPLKKVFSPGNYRRQVEESSESPIQFPNPEIEPGGEYLRTPQEYETASVHEPEEKPRWGI